jgi:hypothetical protein
VHSCYIHRADILLSKYDTLHNQNKYIRTHNVLKSMNTFGMAPKQYPRKWDPFVDIQSRKKTGSVALHESPSTSNCVSTVTKEKQGLPSPLHKPLFYFVLLSLITRVPHGGTTSDANHVIYANTTLFPGECYQCLHKETGFEGSVLKILQEFYCCCFWVMDAPTLQDDLYLDLVGWSSHNVLAVRLWSSIYLWNACSKKASNQCHCCKISLLKVEERYDANLSLINSSRYVIGGRTKLIFRWVERNMALTSL